MKSTVLIAAILCLAGHALYAVSDWVVTPVFEFATAQGPLPVESVGITGYRTGFKKKPAMEPEARGMIVAASVTAGSHQFILLAISTGGGSCAYRYRILDLAPERNPYLTQDFGNCAFGPTVRFEGDSLAM